MVRFEINGRKIGEGYPCFIIAEAGVNHNGNINLAYKLAETAKESGADAVKFQTFKTENLVLKGAPQAVYQKKNARSKDQYEMLKSLELSYKDFQNLKEKCERLKITFLSTPFDEESADFLYKINVPAFKVGSGDFNNLPLLKKIASYKRPIILSCGMAELDEVKKVVNAVRKFGAKKIGLLHCVSSYPAPYKEANLKIIPKFKSIFKMPIGFSDHTVGIHISVAAVALGANVLEKHFTLDKNMKGPDHQSSLEPNELQKMIREIRDVESALGGDRKKIQPSEKNTFQVAKKSLVAKRDIMKGEKINIDMITSKRPFGGIDPMMADKLIGKYAKINIKKDAILKWEYFK